MRFEKIIIFSQIQLSGDAFRKRSELEQRVLSFIKLAVVKVVVLTGFANVDDLLKLRARRSACPGICMTEGCDFIGSTRPNEQEGKCEACGGTTVVSVLVLAGIV